jgi:hypothetical protein
MEGGMSLLKNDFTLLRGQNILGREKKFVLEATKRREKSVQSGTTASMK